MSEMMSEMKIVEVASQPAVSVSATVGTFKMPALMGKTYATLGEAVTGSGVACGAHSGIGPDLDIGDQEMPVGFPYCIYRQIEWEKVTKTNPIALIRMMFFKKWHIEMGVIANEGVTGEGATQATFPGGRYLLAIHVGPYNSVGKTYARMWRHIQERGMACDNFSIERYLNDPHGISPKEIKTELLIPLIQS